VSYTDCQNGQRTFRPLPSKPHLLNNFRLASELLWFIASEVNGLVVYALLFAILLLVAVTFVSGLVESTRRRT
jgi:hypothetical protein